MLSIDLLDWDLEERFLEIKDESVGKYLTYNSSTATIQSAMSRIYIKNNQPVTGSFKLTSPKGAKLLLALDGNLDAFKVEPKITYVDDNDVNFTITPLIQDPKIDYHTQLHIYLVHPDSSVSELDEDVMREGGVYKHYTIILPQQ